MKPQDSHPRSFAKTISLLTLAAAIVTLANCSKKDDASSTDTSDATFTSIYTNTFKGNTCITCHVPGGAPYVDGIPLDFTTQTTAYSTLTAGTAVSPSNPTSSCVGVAYVASGSPSTSYLMGVLSSSFNTNDFGGTAGCQPYTQHLTDQNVSSTELSNIQAWISAGAQNN